MKSNLIKCKFLYYHKLEDNCKISMTRKLDKKFFVNWKNFRLQIVKLMENTEKLK